MITALMLLVLILDLGVQGFWTVIGVLADEGDRS
jgi:hypothetical protein